MDFTIRAATLEDCKDIARMITELAEYEKVADHVKITQKDLEQDGFSKNPFFHGIIAEVPEQHRTKDGRTKVGYSLYFYTYSSWKGRAVYMEDLYVMPEFRGKGIGKALMSKVAQHIEDGEQGYRLIHKDVISSLTVNSPEINLLYSHMGSLGNYLDFVPGGWQDKVRLGLAAGCTQLNFAVLDWNKPSLDFYLSQGCFDITSDLGYHCMRCEGDALELLAQGDP